MVLCSCYITRFLGVLFIIVTIERLHCCVSANQSTEFFDGSVAQSPTTVVTTATDATKNAETSSDATTVAETSSDATTVAETSSDATTVAETSSIQITERAAVEEVETGRRSALTIGDSLLSTLNAMGGSRSLQVQKCCPPNQALRLGRAGSRAQCVEDDALFDAPICDSNMTHYWKINYSLQDVNFVHRDPCILKIFYEEDEEFCLLSNSSLYSSTYYEMLSLDQYCMETIILENGKKHTTGCICTTPPEKNIYSYIYGAGQVISVLVLAVLAVCSVFRTDINYRRKLCLSCFSTTMAATFLIMALHNFLSDYLHPYVTICTGYIVHYLILSYFAWLNILCFDTFYRTKIFNGEFAHKTKYFLIGFLSPLPFILISFADAFRPALPDLYIQSIDSSGVVWCLCLFYLAILCPLLINIFLISIQADTVQNLKEFCENIRSNRFQEIKNRKRRTCFLLLIMYIFMLLDLTIYLLPSTAEVQQHFIIRDVVSSLQGLFVTLVFFQKKFFRKNGREYGNDTALKNGRMCTNVQNFGEEETCLQNGETN